MRLTFQRRALIGQEIRQRQRASVVWSVLAVLVWFAAWALVLLAMSGCASKPDAFDIMFEELANRNLQQMQARTLQLQRQPGRMP